MSTVATTPSTSSYSHPSPAVDQRKSVRVTLPQGGIPVTCHRGSRVLLSKANSLGERGAFIFTTNPFPLGSSFTLEFAFAPKICVHARVRCSLRSLGMGVEFHSLDGASKSLLHQWLASK